MKLFKFLKMKLTLGTLIDLFLYGALILFPLSITFKIFSFDDFVHPMLSIRFLIADFFILFALILWLAKHKSLKNLNLFNQSITFFVSIAFLSYVNAFSLKDWLKEVSQYFFYFGIFFFLLTNHLKSKKQIIFGIYSLFGGICLVLLVATIQNFFLSADPYLVRSFFENRNLLGVYLGMAMPLFFSYSLYASRLLIKLMIWGLCILSFFLVMTAEAFFVLLIALGTICILTGKQISATYGILAVIFLTLFFISGPDKNISALKESLSVYDTDVNKSHNRLQTILYSLGERSIWGKYWGDKRLLIKQDDLFTAKLPLNVNKTGRYAELSGDHHIKQKFVEWQAGLQLMSSFPVFGCGLGNYQNKIGVSYFDLPKINTMEPHSYNGYIQIGATMGILGLWAYFYMLATLVKKVWRACINASNQLSQMLSRGLFATLISIVVLHNFSSVFNAGLFPLFIFIFFLVEALPLMEETTG